VGFFRLGMVTDLRNGFTHLGELKKAKKNPQLLQPKIEGLKAKLKILQRHPTKHRGEIESIQYALNQMKPKNLASTIRERRFIMENQMLQLVQGQIKENFAHIQANREETTFFLAHIGLLNRKTDQLDKRGWEHNEANSMADMHEIFKEFTGKKIIF